MFLDFTETGSFCMSLQPDLLDSDCTASPSILVNHHPNQIPEPILRILFKKIAKSSFHL